MATMSVSGTRFELLALLLLIGLLDAATVRGADDEATSRAPPVPAVPPRFAHLPLGVPETMHRVTALEFSPDGKYLASAHGWYERGGSLQVWDVNTGMRVGLQILPVGVSSIGWTAEGRHLAISVWDTTVRGYDFPALEQKARIAIDRSVARLAISPDGMQMVTAAEGHTPKDDSSGRSVQIRDAASGALVRACESDNKLFRLSCVAWSPTGKYVAAAGGYHGQQIGLGRLWFADTGKEAARLEGDSGYILAIRFFPDDSRVATAGLDGNVRLWDSATGKMVSRFAAGPLIEGLDVSPDGTLLASGSAGGEVALWSPEQNRKVADLCKSGPPVHSVAFARDGKLLASGHSDGIIRVWNVPDQKLAQELPALGSDDRPGRIQALSSLAEGQIAVIGYDTGLLRAVDVIRQTDVWQRNTGKGRSPTAIALASDQKRLLVGCEDGTVRLHSADDGALKLELKKMPSRITGAAMGNNGKWLAAGDADGRVWLWDQEGKTLRGQRRDHRGAVLAIGFADEDRLVTSIGADGTAICRKTLADEIVVEARVNAGPVAAARISDDGSTAVVIGQQVAVWDAVTLKRRSEVRLQVSKQSATAVTPDASLVVVGHALGTSLFDGRQEGTIAPVQATGSRDGGIYALSADHRVLLQGTSVGTLLVWRAVPPRVPPLARIRRVGNAVALAASADGKWLAGGGDDAQVTVWNLATGEIVETLPGGAGTIYACQFSADSQMLATANLNGLVKVWRVKDWTLQGSHLNPKRKVRSVAFSPDGRWLAIGGSDRSLSIIETKEWETIVEKPGQDHWVEGLAFSPDGSRLYSITGSWDHGDQPVSSTLTVWKVATKKDQPGLEIEPLKKITAHGATSDNLVVTPDGRYVVTGSAEGQIKVWDARTLKPIRSIRTPVGMHRLSLMRNDPTRVLLGDSQGGVSVWNLETGVCVAEYASHVGHVFDVTATKDGRLLFSAGEDDFILIWPGPDRAPDDAALRFVKRITEDPQP